MRLALQHPEFGYYRHGDPLGRAGDFVTAPEISQMFGELIGLWCAEMWRLMGCPSDVTLLEMGPGRGTLMQDAMRATAKIPGFHEAVTLHLLESSATLRARQEERLAPHHPVYIESLAALPPKPLIAVSNEFFDALPVRQFEKSFQGWCERCVGFAESGLVFTLTPPDEALKLLIPQTMHDAPPNAVYEISPAAVNAMRDVAQHVARFGGASLALDYGFVQPDGKPTLQAVRGHAYADVLKDPGEADLTALVDFGMLGRAAAAQGVTVYGPVGQGDFLRAMGIELRAEVLKRRATPEQVAAIDHALHRLTDAAEMGTLFKALAFSAKPVADMPGF